MKYKIGSLVKNKNYGDAGIVTSVYNNWEDLKSKNDFLTMDDNSMTDIEKLINGDPKDKWLELQDIKYSEKDLNNTWYSVKLPLNGSIWISHNRLELIQNLN